MTASAKDIAKEKLLNYLGNPENVWLTRQKLSVEVLGYKSSNQMNCLFTAAEIQEIEHEAFEMRKLNSTPQRSLVYAALLREASNGNVQAMKEYLDRTEGKVTDKIKMDADVKADITLNMSDEEIDAEIKRLLEE